jgi:PIN domain nuclease of toxin-antitoxin system
MHLLLDTHVWIWLRYRPDRLRTGLHDQLAAAEAVALSVITPWEIALGHSVGRMRESIVPLNEDDARFPILPILPRHAGLIATLPWHHRDPFDRMLVAQALADGLVIVTADRAIRAYDVPILPA